MSGKVLFLDIETSPNVVLSWRAGYKINIAPDNIVEERRIICICYKWQGEKEVHSLTWDHRQNDKSMLRKFSKVLDSADLVVGHNADKFDMKWVNGRVAYHGLPPLNAQASVDTLKQSRKAFNLNSHKLDYLGTLFIGEKKIKVDFDLWKKVMLGNDRKALDKMVKYCKQDVKLLEKVYNHIQPYVRQTVHQGILKGGDDMCCKSCGSSKTKWNGDRIANKIVYRTRRCNACGHFWRTGVRSGSS